MQRWCGSWPGRQGRHMADVTSDAPDRQDLPAHTPLEAGLLRPAGTCAPIEKH